MVPPFGRKPTGSAQGAPATGHETVLQHLREQEAAQPDLRAQVAGKVLFDGLCLSLRTERGVRIEDLLGLLAATGGHAALLAALDELKTRDTKPDEIIVANGKDGHRYIFGNLPNAYLLESRRGLLNLALGSAQAIGAVGLKDALAEAQRRGAKSVGTEAFGDPDVPDHNRPAISPIDYIRSAWPRILSDLDLYEVEPRARATAIGFALRNALTKSRGTIDPTVAARIVIEYAVPAAKYDPARFA